MKKLIYKSPKIHLSYIQMEEPLASSSGDTYNYSLTIDPSPGSINVVEYSEKEQRETDINIYF